ncbi:MAG: hypothetical protein A2Y77_12355 [Planctomycetes bacterium RBG_13_62_9]|nr:MAG: hypothetical protein A2Y77_12355 [Planctomycetes bacterium RBG_13_62_9]
MRILLKKLARLFGGHECIGMPARERVLPNDINEVCNGGYPPLDGLASGSGEAQERQRQAVAEVGLPLEVKAAKSEIVFRLIPPGTFTMGDEDYGEHQVTLTKLFYCGKFPVTQGQWQAVMDNNPSYFKDAGREAPVERVSWRDCQAFLNKLCRMEGAADGTYRLLTEAEWECACRAGSTSAFCFGDNDSALDEYGWYDGNGGDSTHPVGQKRANAFGLYDMHGNVWEWCQDWYDAYTGESLADPLGPPCGYDRVNRGGSWRSHAWGCRSALRFRCTPGHRDHFLGLRLGRITASYAKGFWARVTARAVKHVAGLGVQGGVAPPS